jgi:nucleoporin POM152
MSPISTAQLNHDGQSFCLAPPVNAVLVPVLLNNTNPSGLRYSLTPLGYTEDGGHGKVEYFDLTAKDLKVIEQTRAEGLQLTRPSFPAKRDLDEYDEYDDDDDEGAETSNPHSSLQKTQSLVHIRLTKPGTVRLERVRDASNVDARLGYPSEVTIVPCPHVEFVHDGSREVDVRCAGQDLDLQMMIDIHGLPPLSLRWFRAVNGKREHFLVEGIEGGHDHDHRLKHRPDGDLESELVEENGRAVVRRKGVLQELRVPLSVSLDTVGTYLYVLEEVMDALGNIVRVGSDNDDNTSHNTKSTRSLTVLRRPTMSFKYCGPGNPMSLLVGSEAPLTISANEADEFDAPWEVTLKYQPSIGSDDGNKGNKRFKPWKKTLTTQNNRRELTVGANAPGEYTIVGVKGKVSFPVISGSFSFLN